MDALWVVMRVAAFYQVGKALAAGTLEDELFKTTSSRLLNLHQLL